MHKPLNTTQQAALKSALETGLRKGFEAALGSDIERDLKKAIQSIKLGEEAEEHTGSAGCLAYFCTEETSVPHLYNEFPSAYWKWEEAIQDTLTPLGYFMENINNCELSIWHV